MGIIDKISKRKPAVKRAKKAAIRKAQFTNEVTAGISRERNNSNGTEETASIDTFIDVSGTFLYSY